jgi:uncharacterized protein with HEPN domain
MNAFLKKRIDKEAPYMYDRKKAKGMRDIISHHYFETDAEVICDVCKNHIPELAQTINKMIRKLS